MNVQLFAVTLRGWEGDRRSGNALAMCYRLCGLSTYGLKANVKEMSTTAMGTALLHLLLSIIVKNLAVYNAF